MRRRILASLAKSGGWVNPYVTDGLIAMWDGEWNVGGGFHNSNSTIWKDLSGNGYDIPMGSVTFGDNYAILGRTLGTADNSSEFTLPLSLLGKPITIEAVYRATQYDTSKYNQNVGFGLYNSSRGYGSLLASYAKLGFSETDGLRVFGFIQPYSNQTTHYMGLNVLDATISDLYSISFITSGTTSGNSMSINGVEVDITNIRQETNVLNQTDSFYLMSQAYNQGRAYRIAIYSKSLSSDERQRNFEIDKARFNLPDAA